MGMTAEIEDARTKPKGSLFDSLPNKPFQDYIAIQGAVGPTGPLYRKGLEALNKPW